MLGSSCAAQGRNALTQCAPFFSVAPMEGLTDAIFRRVHADIFGPLSLYYTPFVTPTVEPRFTVRQMRQIDPVINANLKVVPQLLTRRAADFIWAARALSLMGYTEVNLNVGCPAGTVVAKGKGAGFLREPLALAEFFDRIFEQDLGIAVSVKTRLGWDRPEQFEGLAQLFCRYPIARLIVHARVKTDQYKGHARWQALEAALPVVTRPLGINGDLVTVDDLRQARSRFNRAPQGLAEIMVGRGLMADPALFRKALGGAGVTLAELMHLHTSLWQAYSALFQSRRNATMRMKEHWFYWLNLFAETSDSGQSLTRCSKAIFRAKTESDFTEAIDRIVSEFALLPQARFGWFKPLV